MAEYKEDLAQEFQELIASISTDIGKNTVIPVVQETQQSWKRQIEEISREFTHQQKKEIEVFQKKYKEIIDGLQILGKQVERDWGKHLLNTQNVITSLTQTTNQSQSAILTSVNAFELAKKNLQNLAQSLDIAQKQSEEKLQAFKKDLFIRLEEEEKYKERSLEQIQKAEKEALESLLTMLEEEEKSRIKSLEQIQKAEKEIQESKKIIANSSQKIENQIQSIYHTWDSQQKSTQSMEKQNKENLDIMKKSAEYAQKAQEEVKGHLERIHFSISEWIYKIQKLSQDWEKKLADLSQQMLLEQDKAKKNASDRFSSVEQAQKKTIDGLDQSIKKLSQDWEKKLADFSQQMLLEQDKAKKNASDRFSSVEQAQKKTIDGLDQSIKKLSQDWEKKLADFSQQMLLEQDKAKKNASDRFASLEQAQKKVLDSSEQSVKIVEKSQQCLQNLQSHGDTFIFNSQEIMAEMKKSLEEQNESIAQIHKEAKDSLESIIQHTQELHSITKETQSSHEKSRMIFEQFQITAQETDNRLKNALQELLQWHDSLCLQIKTSDESIQTMGKQLEISAAYFSETKQIVRNQKIENRIWFSILSIINIVLMYLLFTLMSGVK